VGRANGQVVKLHSDLLVEQDVYQADGAITMGPVMGPGGQVLVGTAGNWLYSLNEDLTLRWERFIGKPLTGVPAFSADALYIVAGDRLRAFSPFSGAPLWNRDLGFGTGQGSVAVGYGREIYAQTGSSKVVAYGEAWIAMPIQVTAEATRIGSTRRGVRVEWLLDPPPPPPPSRGAGSALAAPVDVLLQRSADGSIWEDVAIVPAGTTAYTDTGVMDDTSYAYRVQALGTSGDDSDFSFTLEDVQSLPAPPSAPTLLTVTVEAADTLGLQYRSPGGDVVGGYRIERGLDAGGPFSTTLEVGGSVTATVDVGLDPSTTYYYRVTAVNGAGESGPSNVLSGTTRSLTLAPPQNVTADLQADGRVELNWDAGPLGATTVVEFTAGGVDGYLPLGTTGAAGPFGDHPGEPNTYVYRLKFVLGDAESPYAETGTVIVEEEKRVYLPLVMNN
jgi:hypothetical protein